MLFFYFQDFILVVIMYIHILNFVLAPHLYNIKIEQILYQSNA